MYHVNKKDPVIEKRTQIGYFFFGHGPSSTSAFFI